MPTVMYTSLSVGTIGQCSMYVVLNLAMFVTCVNYLQMALMVSEPDVTLMRLPFYNF